MKKLLNQLLCIILLIVSLDTYAQQLYVSQEWDNYTQSVGEINRTVSELDNSQNLIVVSSKANSDGTTDVLITKYSRQGDLLWQQSYNGSGNGSDYGVQVITNSSEDIFVAATIFTSAGMEFGLLKYNSSGVLQWDVTWAGPVNGGVSIPSDLVIDSSGNIYVAGGTQAVNGFSDYAIVKFNSSGTLQWDSSYDYADLHDAVTGIALYNSKVVVTGASASTATNWDYATVDFLQSDGSYVGEKRSVVAGVGLDNAVAITTDNDNNIYVTGYVEVNGNRNIQTVKIDEDFGLEWVRTFNGGLEDVARAVGIDDFGNVYVTGYTEKPGGEIVMITIKYDEDGNDIWSKKYFANDGTDARAENLIVSVDGGVIIAGTVQKTDSKYFTTLKYDEVGNLKFLKEFNSGNGDDIVETMSVQGNEIYVSGTSDNGDSTNVTTVKYTVREKEINYVLNSDGLPSYEENDLIVRFDTSALIHSTIDNKEYVAGPMEKFLRPNALQQVRTALAQVCGSDKCDVTAYKIFRHLNTSSTTTISRLGEEIPVPQFWATLILELPKTVDISISKNNLEGLFPLIKYVDPNIVAITANSPYTYTNSGTNETNENAEPNDDEYEDLQANLHPVLPQFPNAHINMEGAWEYETGKPFIKVGVFDTGIQWSHPDFIFSDDNDDPTENNTKVVAGWNTDTDLPIFYTENELVDDGNHGTKCAGIIGALRNNEHQIAGIAGGNNYDDDEGLVIYDPDSIGVSLYSIKILDNANDLFTTELNNVTESIVTASMSEGSDPFYYGLHIMNHSWIYTDVDESFFTDENFNLMVEAAHFANRANVTYVAAGGNFGNLQPQSTNVRYPANLDDDWILTVGATGSNGNYKTINNGLPSFAGSTGSSLDIAAPAVLDVVRTTSTDFAGTFENPIITNSTQTFFGTSASTPHATGLASILMSYLNDPSDSFNNLAPEDVEEILQMSATDTDVVAFPGPDTLTGFGRLNADLALNLVDKSQFKLSHFKSSSSSNIVTSLELSNVIVQVSEAYQNQAGDWFLPDVDYEVNVYKSSATVNHGLQPTTTIISSWERHSASSPFPLIVNNELLPRERIAIDMIDNISAQLSGYFYEVSDLNSNSLGWWPFDPFQIDPDFDYSVLHDDPLFLNITENNIPTSVVLYPNPSNGIQTMRLSLEKGEMTNVDLYDTRGKLVRNLYNGKLRAGLTEMNFSLSDLRPGLYIYTIRSGTRVKNIRTVLE